MAWLLTAWYRRKSHAEAACAEVQHWWESKLCEPGMAWGRAHPGYVVRARLPVIVRAGSVMRTRLDAHYLDVLCRFPL